MLDERTADNIKKGEYDTEFDKLAAFLFELYKKKKQAKSIEKAVEEAKVNG